jgi:Ca-activated chloride channel homolog
MFWDIYRVIGCTTENGGRSRSGCGRRGDCLHSPFTQGRAITGRGTELVARALLVFLLGSLALAAPCARAQNDPFSPIQQPKMPPPPPDSQQPSGTRLKSTVDLVALHVTVTNKKGDLITTLNKNNFEVFENKVKQDISLFSRADVPVTAGLVIDNSGSMREKRAQVNAAAVTFMKTSNPEDEMFVVNFNDEYYLDTPGDFTNSPKALQDALARIDTHGSTALYDAVVGSLNHLKKGHRDKRVLLLVTDGDDDASRLTFPQTIRAAEKSDAAIYAIGIYSQDDRQHDKRMVRRSTKVLKELAEATGGRAYFPADLSQVEPICERVAREIRSQYTIGYYPTNMAHDGRYREVSVKVMAPKGMGKLEVLTRPGYYAPGNGTDASGN